MSSTPVSLKVPEKNKQLKVSTPSLPEFSYQEPEEEEDAAERFQKFGFTKTASAATQKQSLRWALLAGYQRNDVKSIEKSFVHHVEYSLAKRRMNLDSFGVFKAAALSVRDRLLERWKDTQDFFFEKDVKRVAYLSLEFLMGRTLQNAISNLRLDQAFKEALRNLGYDLEAVYEQEVDAGLGNGGLGRLAACFMDSMATLDLPAWGYGLRYQYGMFHQGIVDGQQVEFPDFWLAQGNPWEVERVDIAYTIKLYGTVTEHSDGRMEWVDTENVVALAYDTPIPGYDTYNTLNVRLWSAKPATEFDLEHFNSGNYMKSIEARQKAEQITQVLYPNDNTPEGKELRLKQQYFFVSATLQDLIRRFKRRGKPMDEFPEKIAVQLNDTHPTLAIVEMMRFLLDFERMGYEEAWEITGRTFAYTNHTVLPEALETWEVPLLEKLLPRHMQIIYMINHHWMREVGERFPGDWNKMSVLSIIQEGAPKRVRMANLAIVACHSVNGVARIHSNILVERIFRDFHEYFPTKFQNKTNGVTPRRWVQQANPDLAELITSYLGSDAWLVDWNLLPGLQKFAQDSKFQALFSSVKQIAKDRLAEHMRATMGVELDSKRFMFDVQVKRIHEYKRQLMNILYTIHRYTEIKAMAPAEREEQLVPRAVLFGGKAAPGYFSAKLIIRLIAAASEVINADPEVNQYLRVYFLPNYNVSLAEVIIPAADVSQHISTAGMEASGTSNMKFAMNGSLILGTLDGANVEIREHIGEANMFIFGTLAQDVETQRHRVRCEQVPMEPRFAAVLALLRSDMFGDPKVWKPLLNSLEAGNDHYLLNVDFASYCDAQREVDAAYRDQARWVPMAIESVALSGAFSSDRTIQQYAKEIWDVESLRRPGPETMSVNDFQNVGLVSDVGDLSISPAVSHLAVQLEKRSEPSHPKYTSIPAEIEKGFQL